MTGARRVAAGAVALALVVGAVALAWPRGEDAPIGFPCLAVPSETLREVVGAGELASIGVDGRGGTSVDGERVATVTCERLSAAARDRYGLDGDAPAWTREVSRFSSPSSTQLELVRDGVLVTIEVARPLTDQEADVIVAGWSEEVDAADSGRPSGWLLVTAFALPLLLIAAGRLVADHVEQDRRELSVPLRLLVTLGSLDVGLGAGLSRMARLLPDSWSDHPDVKHPRHGDRWPPP